MARKTSQSRSYLSTEGAGVAPARTERKRTARVETGVTAIAEAPEACAPKSAEFQTEFNISEQEEIERLAYSYYEARGGQEGSSEDDWFRAEQEVRRRRATTNR
ncbi:MAG: DUF2934 domain-containing protein [Bryobacteraceae bacterium]